MFLSKAENIANEIVNGLSPYCNRIVVAGSIRRHKSFVGDIDLVAIPSNQGRFLYTLQQFGRIERGGGKVIRVDMKVTMGIDLDMYVATPEIWATLLLIRTGSAQHNIKLCKLARSKGMKLHADGSGLFKIAPRQTPYDDLEDERIAGDTEASIFEALEIPFVPPEKREV